jgi:hypothetical protein
VSFAEIVDAGKNADGSMWVEYLNVADNSTWRNGSDAGDGQFSSGELTKVPQSAMHGTDGARIRALKVALKGVVQ